MPQALIHNLQAIGVEEREDDVAEGVARPRPAPGHRGVVEALHHPEDVRVGLRRDAPEVAGNSCPLEHRRAGEEAPKLLEGLPQDVLAELAARVAAEGYEQRLAWLQLVVPPCGDESRQAAACPPPRALTQLAVACAECSQLRSEFLAWVGDLGPGQGRWAAVEEVALRIGAELQRGRHGLAAALAAVTPVPD